MVPGAVRLRSSPWALPTLPTDVRRLLFWRCLDICSARWDASECVVSIEKEHVLVEFWCCRSLHTPDRKAALSSPFPITRP
eukprot:2515799-Pyramimonas_sp.AAC.1